MSNLGKKKAVNVAPGYWSLVKSGEPFRLLFPVGVMLGIYGVAMWPLNVWHVTGMYPGQFHARVMIEGFVTAFVIGFLGTALPRLLGVPKMTLVETLGFAAAVIGIVVMQAGGHMLGGDQLFFVTFFSFALVLGVRALLFRQDVPPPGFMLVILGVMSAFVGVSILIVSQISAGVLPEWMPVFGRFLLYQGYPLFPIMGIGAFLLPRFFGEQGNQNFPESLSLPPGWIPRALQAMTCGGIVMVGFVVESMGNAVWGNGLKAAGVLIYFVREIPAHKTKFSGGSMVLGVRLSLFCIPLAYVLLAAMPGRGLTLLHVFFITGVSLLIFTVATRVVFGHGGQSEKFRQRLWYLLATFFLLVLAMSGRVTADWLSTGQQRHYAYAALLWILGVLIWSVFVLPGVRREDEE